MNWLSIECERSEKSQVHIGLFSGILDESFKQSVFVKKIRGRITMILRGAAWCKYELTLRVA